MHRFLMIYKSFYFLIYKLYVSSFYDIVNYYFFSIQQTSLCFFFLLLLVETVYSKQSQNFFVFKMFVCERNFLKTQQYFIKF